MKKRAAALLMAVWMGAFCMAGCGNGKGTPANQSSADSTRDSLEISASAEGEKAVSESSSSNPEPTKEEQAKTESPEKWKDGKYTVELTFEGGSGKSKILSPAAVEVSQGTVTALVEWSSPNYDYMLVDGQKYLPVNTEGNSVFEIPVLSFDAPMEIIGDTVAMGTPREITYTITFHADTAKVAE